MMVRRPDPQLSARIWMRSVCCAALLLLVTACTEARRYTSLDLALLPCEEGNAPIFFRAIEFDEHGTPAFLSQVTQLRELLTDGPPVTDLVFFVHGWNKNPSSAEVDYQNFLCRLHARLRVVIGDQKRSGGLRVVGIFWPSTITNKTQDPVLMKPVSYYRIRDRADTVAQKGLAPVLASLEPHFHAQRGGLPVRLQLIGHSFGARMLVRAMETLSNEGQLVPLLQAAGTVNVVLLNAAVPPERFEWLSRAVVKAKREGTRARFTEETNSYLFNVHSFNDAANRVLFRVASVFNDDPSVCAAGACGVPTFATLCVDYSGKVRPSATRAPPRRQLNDRLNAWNVDATSIVFDHSDIYKGRIASLVADLVYGEKVAFPGADQELPDTKTRCSSLGLP